MEQKTKISIAIALGAFLWYSIAINKKLNHITKHIVTHEWETTIKMQKEVIDSLQQEIMDIGWKNDSLTLKHEHGWEFTN